MRSFRDELNNLGFNVIYHKIEDKIFNVDYMKKVNIVIKDKKEILLPRKEFELLFLLVNKPEKVFTREEIMNKVWGTQVVVGDRTIDVHVRKLREKIGEKHIKTLKGVGYKFKS